MSRAKAERRLEREATGKASEAGVTTPAVETAPPASPDASSAAITTSADLAIADDHVVLEPLHATGDVRVGARARVENAIRAGGIAQVGDGAQIEGALDVEGSLAWGRGARAKTVRTGGPLTSADGTVRARLLIAEGGVRSEDGGE